jgi:hypothetical protein
MEMNLTFGGKNNLESTPSPKLITLPKPPVLTQSEIELLRQDLKDSSSLGINPKAQSSSHLKVTNYPMPTGIGFKLKILIL